MTRFIPVVLTFLFLSGCSGWMAGWGDGPVVPPAEVARFRGGGSMSTLWYYGSDENYHYFGHFVKVSTRYRVRRDELPMEATFPYKSRDPQFIGNSPMWYDMELPRRGKDV